MVAVCLCRSRVLDTGSAAASWRGGQSDDQTGVSIVKLYSNYIGVMHV